MILCGIDPGLTGAVALIDVDPARLLAPTLLHVADMPTAEAKQGRAIKRHLDLPALAAILQHPLFPAPEAVMVEEVHAMPGQGVTSMFRFGFAAGAVAGVVAALGLPLTYIRPQEWRALAGVREGKDAGRLRASQLFPTQSAAFSRVKDHGRADAALIAFSGARKFLA